ncbi:MAG: hypothetical protein ACMXYC_02310 [Candidatus Woesearchaeota archaeon]
MRVFKSPKFQKKAEKLLSASGLHELDKYIDELKNGNISGKPLTYDFLREKKLEIKECIFSYMNK